MSDFEIPALMEEFQAAFQPMMASVAGLREMISEIIPICKDLEKRQQFETEVLREVPALAAETEAGIRAGMAELQTMSGQIDALDGRLKELDAQMVEACKDAEARRLAQAAEPAQLSAAAKASAYLESLRAKQPAIQSAGPLKDGDLLVRQLLAICEPKAQPEPPRQRRELGNIWEYWEEAAARDAAEDAARKRK